MSVTHFLLFLLFFDFLDEARLSEEEDLDRPILFHLKKQLGLFFNFFLRKSRNLTCYSQCSQLIVVVVCLWDLQDLQVLFMCLIGQRHIQMSAFYQTVGFFGYQKYDQCGQWLIAQLVERSLSVMKDPGSNLGADICSFRY